MKSSFIVVGALAAVLGLTRGLAAAQSTMPVQFTIPFSFLVGDREFPPGRYEVRPEGTGFTQLTLRNIDDGTKIVLPVATRPAERGDADPQVVFDKTGETHYLSEIHVPGSDGHAVKGAPGEHKHERLVGAT
jgi:hypothetical protein